MSKRKKATPPSKRLRAVFNRPQSLAAKYDVAQTTVDNRRHWANADFFSAAQSLTPDVRLKLRTRARYEVQNNSYANGIVQTLANDTVGRGPRLQILTGDPVDAARVEEVFHHWMAAAGIAEKLRTMRFSKAQDGEAFGQFIANKNESWASPVKLDMILVECDRVAAPVFSGSLMANLGDGIEYDADWNPISYTILNQHPGENAGLNPLSSVVRSASDVVHYFRPDRPGQLRGAPDLTPAISLFAQLRRFTQSVLGAAETAASFAAVLQTDAPPAGEADAEVQAGEVYPLEHRLMTVLPAGWKLGQVEAQQPSTTYEMFKREILNEIARCLNMPYNIAAANSSSYNYASGRLDHQTYFKAIRVEQARMESQVLDVMFSRWVAEAKLIERLLPEEFRRTVEEGEPLDTRFAHQWYWDGSEHVDPAKEANAQEIRLRNHTTTLAREYGRLGLDWESEVRQKSVEQKLLAELGLPHPAAAPGFPVEKPEE